VAFETKEDILLRVFTQERPKCTFCGNKMSIWEVPQFSFEDGLGWDNIRRNYGRYASYRCICYPGMSFLCRNNKKKGKGL